MPHKDAEKYIREIVGNRELRSSLYAYDTSLEMMNSIHDAGYHFKLHEFEESINYLKTESPTEDQAFMLDDILQWWKMLMFDGSIIQDQKECSSAKCSSCRGC